MIVTWQVRDRLLFRPVERGQVLMSVADKTGEWELEIHMPDDRLGHINRALADAQAEGRKLEVDYIVATDPGTRHYGTVEEIHEQAEVRGEQGNTVLVQITIDPSNHEKEELGAGATVTARVNCGPHAMGYVWLMDVMAFFSHGSSGERPRLITTRPKPSRKAMSMSVIPSRLSRWLRPNWRRPWRPIAGFPVA
ncbi:MAG: HlyD family secretion protein [Planctomycetia bacterium]|nr:HlyD family secretion protein [Planctomycetia bacterium]